MPGRRAVVAVAVAGIVDRSRNARHQRRALLRTKRLDAAVERDEAGEEAVEPSPLLGSERRRVRNKLDCWRRDVVRHSTTSASNMAMSCSSLCRRVKAMN